MYFFVKRAGDILLSTICLIVLMPFFFLVIIVLRFTGEGEIFYRQERMGSQYKTFGILKFATMLKNSLNIGSKTVTTKNDPRITTVGKWLRSAKINELPQIWNVFVGEMTIVGPRPLLISSFKKYTKEVQNIISEIKPGITGLGSIVFRDEEKLVSEIKRLGGDPLSFYKMYIYPYKGALEVYYSKNISFTTDIKIIFITGWKIIFRSSNIEYVLFPDLPQKPDSLTVSGINKLDMSKIKEKSSF